MPNGRMFELDVSDPGRYLYHRSDLGEFFLSSDSAVQTFTRWDQTKPFTTQLPQSENDAFLSLAYTIGGMMVFPANKVDGKMTINGVRGFNRKIADRMDLTLEAIRRHYVGEPSPIGTTLLRYADFFELFEGFRGYVDFFLLQDLVTDDYEAVRFAMPFDDFQPPSVPRDFDTYLEYRRLTAEFLNARNRRISVAAQAI